MEPQGVAEIAPERACDPIDILDGDRAVGAQLTPQVVQFFLGVGAFAVAQDGQRWVTRNQTHQHENDDGQ